MNNQTRDNKMRKLYRKPKIEQVRLIPEQAVLQSCWASGTVRLGSCQVKVGDCQYG